MTGEELGKRNIAAMGEEAGTPYSLLNNDVAILHPSWKEYVELFGTNPCCTSLSERKSMKLQS